MIRFQRATHPALYWAIGLSLAGTLLLDVMTSVGFTMWILYLVPVVLCFFVTRPIVPLLVASTVTVLLVFGFFVSPPGIDPVMGLANRSVGLLVVWIGAIQARNVIASRLRLKEEDWLRAGRARLADCMTGEQSIQALANRVLRFITEYVDAQAGALYVAEGDGRFRRYAGVGLPSDSSAPETLQPGEGLVGRAIAERRLLELRELPPDYLKIGSGLGSRGPHALLIAPLATPDGVYGAVELGFLHPSLVSDVDFLSTLSEPLALGLRAGLLGRERERLLRETKRQAEELQAQQEELRVANDELVSHSNMLRESQARLECQQAELEQSNVQLEAHAQRLARQNDELEQARRDIAAKAADLARANRYKSEFLANMSHELRTPLNSTLILSKLLADNRTGNLTPEQVKFAKSIHSAGSDLLELINDILDLSKIEARRIELQMQPIEVVSLMEGLVGTFGPMAEDKGIAFTSRVAPDVPPVLTSDSQRLRQILKNLLSNAVKFTERGRVTLEVACRGEQVEFSVTDTGIGIDPQHQQVIFEPFRQADGTTSRRFGGTGLGLSISRELARLLGGRIELQSEVGRGSTFRLLLPKMHFPAEPAAQEAPVVPAPGQVPAIVRSVQPEAQTSPVTPANDDRHLIEDSSRVLLVVEDDPTFANVVCELARELGFRCLVAETADDAITLAQQHRPSAVILDIRLPDHSGLSVLDRLKHNPATRHIPVQVISAEDHCRAAREMGAAGALVKPVPREELVQALSALEERFARRVKAVLVVEDNAVQRESICRLLASDRVSTVGVANGTSALAELRRTTFDCMVLDLSLPDGSGHELLEAMASDETLGFPPVIVYTGRSLSQEEEQRLRRYSRSIIVKGAKSPERLLDEVSLFLHQVEAQLPPDRQRMLHEARARDAAFDGRRILVVEDDVRNIFALSNVLEPLGGTLLIARNGREALEKLATEPQVDLVLMDLMMPEMDGFEAMREIRKSPRHSELPIIALTAKAMPDDQKRCLDAGANDYVSKPVDVEKLVSLIRIWLPR